MQYNIGHAQNSEYNFQFHIFVIENLVEQIIISLHNSLKKLISIYQYS